MTAIRPTAGRTLLLAALLASLLAGCGRKGPLEAPPNVAGATALPDRQIGAEPAEQTELPTATAPFGKAQRTDRAIRVPERAFVLDPLL